MRKEMFDFELDKFKEECGVFGIFSGEKYRVGAITYYGLYALQQDRKSVV